MIRRIGCRRWEGYLPSERSNKHPEWNWFRWKQKRRMTKYWMNICCSSFRPHLQDTDEDVYVNIFFFVFETLKRKYPAMIRSKTKPAVIDDWLCAEYISICQYGEGAENRKLLEKTYVLTQSSIVTASLTEVHLHLQRKSFCYCRFVTKGPNSMVIFPFALNPLHSAWRWRDVNQYLSLCFKLFFARVSSSWSSSYR